jgi:hypothetical protein
MENDGGRRWRTTVADDGERRWRVLQWWLTVGRKWVDGEREGKFLGRLGGGNKNEKDEVLL